MGGLLAPAAPRRRFATDGVDAHEDGASNRVAVVDLTDGGSSGKIEVQNLTVQSDLRPTTMGQSLGFGTLAFGVRRLCFSFGIHLVPAVPRNTLHLGHRPAGHQTSVGLVQRCGPPLVLTTRMVTDASSRVRSRSAFGTPTCPECCLGLLIRRSLHYHRF